MIICSLHYILLQSESFSSESDIYDTLLFTKEPSYLRVSPAEVGFVYATDHSYRDSKFDASMVTLPLGWRNPSTSQIMKFVEVQDDKSERKRNYGKRPQTELQTVQMIETYPNRAPPSHSLEKDLMQLKYIMSSLQEDLRNKSSVDYFACCGLGHRMSKMVDANYIAKQKGFGLRIHWGFCDKVEIFHHFFGPQPASELANVTSTGIALRINNEAPGFEKFVRNGNTTRCQCPKKLSNEESARFYEGLRNRFRYNNEVDAFRQQHFTDHTVIGLHVRAGNNEQGDFVRKKRRIDDEEKWISSVAQNLQKLSQNWEKPPLLFVATDTPSIITGFRRALSEKMPVKTYDQEKEEGKGVLFGESASVASRGKKCLPGWKNSLMDMMLLSYADVIVSGRPSSFTQSLPMTMALDRPFTTREVAYTYCEMNPKGTEYRCYRNFEEWCCSGLTSFHLGGIQAYEYLRKLGRKSDGSLSRRERIRPNSREITLPTRTRTKDAFLPYDWSSV